jgi:hypothetical protein
MTPGAEDDQKLDRWVQAKRTRDFQLADRLRAELEAHGIQPEVARPHAWEAGGRGRGASSGSDWMPHMGRGSGMMGMLPVGRGGGGALPMHGSKGGGKGGKGGGKGGGQGCPPNIDPKAGDWQCVSCGNWNWARRKECNQCHSAKEGLLRVTGAAAGSKRDGLVRSTYGNLLFEADVAARIRTVRSPLRGCREPGSLSLHVPRRAADNGAGRGPRSARMGPRSWLALSLTIPHSLLPFPFLASFYPARARSPWSHPPPPSRLGCPGGRLRRV